MSSRVGSGIHRSTDGEGDLHRRWLDPGSGCPQFGSDGMASLLAANRALVCTALRSSSHPANASTELDHAEQHEGENRKDYGELDQAGALFLTARAPQPTGAYDGAERAAPGGVPHFTMFL